MRREELLSLRLHEAVAHKLQLSPELIEQVRARLDHLSALDQLTPPTEPSPGSSSFEGN